MLRLTWDVRAVSTGLAKLEDISFLTDVWVTDTCQPRVGRNAWIHHVRFASLIFLYVCSHVTGSAHGWLVGWLVGSIPRLTELVSVLKFR